MSKNAPCLVILAAGLGSRYGGLKQMDPMDDSGNVIIDYSMYDAYRAGFRKVVFIIKKENHEEFAEVIGNRAEKRFEIKYAFQDLNDIPEGFSVPSDRAKPWGTAHALYAARDVIDGPFAVINADDYYGINAFKQIYDYLLTVDEGSEKQSYVMIGYQLKNTVSKKGHVARGVCQVSDGKLSSITERTRIEVLKSGEIAYSEDDGQSFTALPEDTIVSMNMWGFTRNLIDEIKPGFANFLSKNIPTNPLKCEYYIPTLVEELLKKDRCTVSVLTSVDRWYGVTYKEDKPQVVQAFAEMRSQGMYPDI